MSTLKSSGQAASDDMYQLHITHAHHPDHSADCIQNHCLETCQDAWGVPPGHYAPDAYHAWLAVPAAHRHTDPTKAPVGAPHFWVNHSGPSFPGYGHIALQSDVIGHVWSTDCQVPNEVGMQTTAWFSSPVGWNMVYLGWTDYLEGYALPVHTMPTKVPGKPNQTVPQKPVVKPAPKPVVKPAAPKSAATVQPSKTTYDVGGTQVKPPTSH